MKELLGATAKIVGTTKHIWPGHRSLAELVPSSTVKRRSPALPSSPKCHNLFFKKSKEKKNLLETRRMRIGVFKTSLHTLKIGSFNVPVISYYL